MLRHLKRITKITLHMLLPQRHIFSKVKIIQPKAVFGLSTAPLERKEEIHHSIVRMFSYDLSLRGIFVALLLRYRFKKRLFILKIIWIFILEHLGPVRWSDVSLLWLNEGCALQKPDFNWTNESNHSVMSHFTQNPGGFAEGDRHVDPGLSPIPSFH